MLGEELPGTKDSESSWKAKTNSAFHQQLTELGVYVCAHVCVCRKDAVNKEESKWETIFKEKTWTTELGLEEAES